MGVGFGSLRGAQAQPAARHRGATGLRLHGCVVIISARAGGKGAPRRKGALLTFQRVPLLTRCAGCPYAEARTRRLVNLQLRRLSNRGDEDPPRRGEPAGRGREKHRRLPSHLMQILRALRGLSFFSSLCHHCAFSLHTVHACPISFSARLCPPAHAQNMRLPEQ